MHSLLKKIPALLAGLMLSAVVANAQPAAVVVNPYKPPANATPLLTTFVDWDALAVKPSAAGETRAVFDNPTATLEKFEMHITTLKPGMASHPVHQHGWEEILLVKEGDLEVSLNGKKLHAGPGNLIFYASHDPHNATNVGDKPATYYVINFVTDLFRTLPDKPALEQAVPGKLPSGIFDCDHAAATPSATGSRAVVVNSPTLTFQQLSTHISTLNVGQATKPDVTDPGDELFIVRAGQLEASINGITCRLNAGSFFYCAPNDKRTFKNIGTTPAAYQVIKVVSAKSPKPVAP